MGWDTALNSLGIAYESADALKFAEEVAAFDARRSASDETRASAHGGYVSARERLKLHGADTVTRARPAPFEREARHSRKMSPPWVDTRRKEPTPLNAASERTVLSAVLGWKETSLAS